MGNEVISEIICPNCNTKITLDEALTRSFEEKMKKQWQADAVQQSSKLFENQLKDLQTQVNEKDELLKKTQDEELKLRSERRKLEEEKQTLDLQVQRKMDEERIKIFDEAMKKATEDHRLKDLEKDKDMNDMKKKIDELQRKAEQGSMKIQGEVFEQEVEKILRENFQYDQIEPISSGINGADILHKVCSRNGQICGIILLESKNTKNWNNTWIQKLKDDQREAKADIALLITTALPDDVNSFTNRDGIFIVHYTMMLPVIALLRIQLHEVARTRNFNVDVSEKKQILYTYLTGTEFRQKIEAIAEAFINMMAELQKEKGAMTKIWKKGRSRYNRHF